MNSASSIEHHVSTDGDAGRAAAGASAPADQTLQAWHFFVLASLAAATAAVIISRQSSPEHLILTSLTIAAAGLAAAGFYRMLAPLASADVPAAAAGTRSSRAREELEREKMLTLRSIKELEFDHAMGKIARPDFETMVGRLRARAIALIKELDEDRPGYQTIIERELESRLASAAPHAAPAGEAGLRCGACGTANDADAAFCKRCGAKIAGASGAS